MRSISRASAIALILAVSQVSGCASMSGIGGSSQYGCKAPDGVRCESVSGNYHNALKNNLPSQRRDPQRSSQPAKLQSVGTASSEMRGVALSAASRVAVGQDGNALPLRSQPRVLRLWYKPWEDADRDLYDQGYVYVQIDAGRWLIDHAAKQTRDAYMPVRPPRVVSSPDRGPASARPLDSQSPTAAIARASEQAARRETSDEDQ